MLPTQKQKWVKFVFVVIIIIITMVGVVCVSQFVAILSWILLFNLISLSLSLIMFICVYGRGRLITVLLLFCCGQV